MQKECLQRYKYCVDFSKLPTYLSRADPLYARFQLVFQMLQLVDLVRPESSCPL